MYYYNIPGRPVTKKNSMQMAYSKEKNRWFPVPSKAYKAYAKEARKALACRPESPIDYPVVVTCQYYLLKNKDGSMPKNLPDLANLIEATMDILVENRILKDDNCGIVISHNDSMVYYMDPTTQFQPQTEITIYKPGEEI